MAGHIGEKSFISLGFLSQMTGGAATLSFTKAYNMQGYNRISILCAMAGSATGAGAYSSTWKLVAGVATEHPSSFTSIANSSLILGNTSNLTFESVNCIHLYAHNSVATGAIFIVDGVTFTFQTGATVADKQIGASNSSAVTKGIATALGLFCPWLETCLGTTGTTGTDIFIRPKSLGAGTERSGVSITVAVNATTTGIETRVIRDYGLIEFTPSDIINVSSSYTHFAVRMQSTATVASQAGCFLIREGGHSSTYGKRTHM
jgi:hypothetical protein